jgi:hypothetical protein
MTGWSSRSDRNFMSFRIGVTKVNFMWCVFHNAQWYWSDNLCKLVTDQLRGSLGVRDSESCWFTEEIGTYMRCWESPGDLPLVIEIFVSFPCFICVLEINGKKHKLSSFYRTIKWIFLPSLAIVINWPSGFRGED